MSKDSEENIQEALEKGLEKIQDILNIKTIKDTFKQFDNVPKTFQGYKNIVAYEAILYKLADNIINESLINLEESDITNNKKSLDDQNSKIKENRKQVIASLNLLKLLASKTAYLKRLAFIFHVLNSPNKKEILFRNISFTEKEINKRFKEIALHFHSDRTNRLNTPILLQEKHKNLGTDIFNFALEFKESLLNDLKELSEIAFHEKNANDLWKITIDYRKAAKGQWNKLELLKKCDIEENSSDELKRLSVENGMLAYQEYRIACKIADIAKQLKKQVELRGYMALCLYVSNKPVEAKLYALSAIHLQFRNIHKITQQEFNEAKKIFNKVKGGDDTTDSTDKLKTDITLNMNSNNTMALIKAVDQKMSIFDKKNIKNSINNDMIRISIELILKADRSLVRYQVSNEKISYAKRALKQTIENLNQIIIKALKAYDKEEYQKFLEVLSEEFNDKTGESLLKLKEHEDPIPISPQGIINTLLKHGFRSDGIAYLLILLGEILGSGKIKIEEKTPKELKVMAMNAFRGALSEKLGAEAEKLDDHIHELRKNRRKSNLSNPIPFKEYITQEDKNDSQEMPFKSRLEEMRNIVRINRAIFDIIDAGEEEIERAVKTIKEIQDSINFNYQFVATKCRYEVLEDLIWVISGDEPPKGSPEEPPKFSLITYIDNEYLSFLNEQLQQATSKQEKVHLYNRIAALHEQLAEKEEKINRLESLYHWKVAQKNYEKAREMDTKNLDASIGFAKCLLKLFKYTQVIELSQTCPNLISLSEYWRLRSISYCKKIDYESAIGDIIEALKLDNKNKLAEGQMLFLKKISKENTIERRINRYKKGINKIDYLKNSDSDKKPVYNILSIDGGGVRGVIPALWLSEIEHRTHKPISHLFDMVAGTSTGGIIAAGLSVPSSTWNEESSNYVFSDSNPKLSALDLLNLYQNRAKNLFVKNSLWILRALNPKYTKYTSSRSSLFEEYFGGVRLNKALTELVIPAVNENDLMQTHLFTRYDARKYVSKNYTFVNTLMATTATPTFFPSHKIEGVGNFLDGALHINNPVMTAYNNAIQYNVAKENISVLSLGTGSYIPDPLNPDLHREQNLHKAALFQQESDIGNKMYSELKNRYQRWQVWFEEPIGLDDYGSIPNLLELGNQYIEELDASDENPINKLVESFEKCF